MKVRMFFNGENIEIEDTSSTICEFVVGEINTALDSADTVTTATMTDSHTNINEIICPDENVKEWVKGLNLKNPEIYSEALSAIMDKWVYKDNSDFEGEREDRRILIQASIEQQDSN